MSSPPAWHSRFGSARRVRWLGAVAIALSVLVGASVWIYGRASEPAGQVSAKATGRQEAPLPTPTSTPSPSGPTAGEHVSADAAPGSVQTSTPGGSDTPTRPATSSASVAGLGPRPEPPAEAVDVRRYGARGDGVSDDTLAIVKALSAHSAILFNSGTYIVNDAIKVGTGKRIYARPGAIIRGGTSMRGDLDNFGTHFTVDGSGAVIDGLTFYEPVKPYSGGWGTDGAAVDIQGASKVTVIRNTFQATMGIAVKRSSATDNFVTHNVLMGGPDITYSYAGASRTTASYNIIDGARGNGMRGTCNTPESPNKGSIVEYNTIVNAGRMGIEDYGDCYDTVIRHNVITSPGQKSADGFGISAVGYRTTITDNRIENFKTYGIESPSASATIARNTIKQTQARLTPRSTAIMVNTHKPAVTAGATVKGNVISAVESGVRVWSDTGTVIVAQNTFHDAQTAISIDSEYSDAQLHALGNTITFTAAVTARPLSAFVTYSTGNTGVKKSQIVGNTVTFASHVAPGQAWLVKVATDNLTVENNTFNGSGSPALVGGGGATNSGLKVINNTFLGGARFDPSGFNAPLARGNH